MPLLALLLVAAAPQLPPELNDPTTTEGWIWQQVQAGKVADLNDRCDTPPLSVYQRNDPLWLDPCRRVVPNFLRALLIQPNLVDYAAHGVVVRGARIDGDLDLADVHVKSVAFGVEGSRIAGDADLNDLQLDGLLSLNGTLIEGKLNGWRAVIGTNLIMEGTVFGGPVNLRSTHVGLMIDMADAVVADRQAFDAERLHTGPDGLYLRKVRFGGPVDLSDAHIDGQLDMEEASVADNQTFDAGSVYVGAAGFLLSDARFGGSVNLCQAHVEGRMELDRARFAGPVSLCDAQVNGLMSMDHARLAKDQMFYAERLHVGGALSLSAAEFGGPVDLENAHIEGQMEMNDASVAAGQAFSAERLHVGSGGLFLRKVMFGGPVDLENAHVDELMRMEGATVANQQTFDAAQLHVGLGGLLLKEAKFGGPIDFSDAHIDGLMSMEGITVAKDQKFDALFLHVGGALSLIAAKFGGPVNLTSAHIVGLMSMEDAKIADRQTFDARYLYVGSDFLVESVTFGGSVDLETLMVDGSLDLRDSHVQQLDLAGAVLRDDLLLGGRWDNGSEHWLRWDACNSPAPCFNLRNTKIGNLQDDKRAWPARMTLGGFTFTHLGGFGGEQSQDLRNREIPWWRDWLNRDPVYSAQPYAQLAGVLAATGNRDGAADIRFFGRDRERSELLRGCTLVEQLTPESQRPCRLGAGLGASALQLFVGYGIGAYAFRAAYWALGLALIGTAILLFAPGVRGVKPPNWAVTKAPRGPRQRSVLWCFGASLHRVLPLITISKEFGDFFDDPARERLTSRQHFAFAVLALCGWALGLFVVAAFSGLIQS